MEYYKFEYPYYAVIAAQNKQKACNIYEEQICSVNQGVELKEISKDEVIREWGKAGHELHELVDIIHEEGTLLIDGCLA